MKSVKPLLQKALGLLVSRAGDGPWRSKSVLAALAAVLVGLGFWCSNLNSSPSQNRTGATITNVPGIASSATASAPAGTQRGWSRPLPFYVPIGASYVAGFCIGWVFRKLIRIIVIVAAFVVALLALGRFAGCDTTRTQEQVKHTGEWAQHAVVATEDYLRHLLPSVGAGGVGTFLGFRRRGRESSPEPGTAPFPPPT